MNRPKCKILISYHKKDFLLKDDILTPIHAGRANALKKEPNESLEWLLKNMIGDNTGDNISDRNGSYNEMTSVYWAWKNYDALGNPEWIGFMHYRRHFLFKDGKASCYENDGIYDEYLDEIGYSKERIEEILADADFVTTRPQYRTSLYEHYKRNHRIEDLDTAIQILKSKYPEYSESADTYLQGPKAYFCNMFIFPKRLFMQYASWIFDILFEFEKQVDISNKRLFISEWLTGIFIQHLIDNGEKGIFLPTIYAEGDHVIPVILAADENYAMPMSVTIASMLKNAKRTTKYDIYILTPQEFSSRSKFLILSLQEFGYGCKITFIKLGNEFSQAPIKTKHLTKVAYYRLLASTVLPQYNKCLYLDVDTVVESDLSILFRMTLDDFFVAGVKAAGYFYPIEWSEAHQKEIGIPSMNQYINSGVLMMDLEKFRHNNVEEKCIALTNNGYSSEDQDIINVVCYGQIKCIHLKYNLMNKYFSKNKTEYVPNEIISKVFSQQEIAEALSSPVIIHFASKIKPWNDPHTSFAEYWWKYVEYSPFYGDGSINSKNLEYEKLALRAKRAEQELVLIRASWTYRIGRTATFVPRMIRKFIRCYRENGWKYTWFKLIEKCKNGFKG